MNLEEKVNVIELHNNSLAKISMFGDTQSSFVSYSIPILMCYFDVCHFLKFSRVVAYVIYKKITHNNM